MKVDLVLPGHNNYIKKNTYLRKTATKTANIVDDKKTPKKQRIRELIKQPKEKFLTKNQEEYWRILGDNEITLCFGPAGVGKSYIAMKRAVDLLWDDSNKFEKIINWVKHKLYMPNLQCLFLTRMCVLY